MHFPPITPASHFLLSLAVNRLPASPPRAIPSARHLHCKYPPSACIVIIPPPLIPSMSAFRRDTGISQAIMGRGVVLRPLPARFPSAVRCSGSSSAPPSPAVSSSPPRICSTSPSESFPPHMLLRRLSPPPPHSPPSGYFTPWPGQPRPPQPRCPTSLSGAPKPHSAGHPNQQLSLPTFSPFLALPIRSTPIQSVLHIYQLPLFLFIPYQSDPLIAFPPHLPSRPPNIVQCPAY